MPREAFDVNVVSGPVPAMDAFDVPHFFAALVLAACARHRRAGGRSRTSLHVGFCMFCAHRIFGPAE